MKSRNKIALPTFALLAVLGAVTAVHAATRDHGRENDARTAPAAAIPLADAVRAAEQHVHGKAARAEYENSRHGWVYDVEVVRGSDVFDVAVDATKGTVLSSTADTADGDDARDRQD